MSKIHCLDRFCYQHNVTYQSFIEFATLDNPKYTLLISLDSPQGSRFADGSVVPKVKKLNEFLLNYFAIPPDK